MRRHKVKSIIKKQGGDFQVVFRDGMRVFWPRESGRGINVGTWVCEYKYKNGQTVAFSWNNELRFVVPQPQYFDNAVEFIENFRFFDRVPFNNAVVRALHYRTDPMILPDTEKIAHNLVLLGLKTTMSKLR